MGELRDAYLAGAAPSAGLDMSSFVASGLAADFLCFFLWVFLAGAGAASSFLAPASAAGASAARARVEPPNRTARVRAVADTSLFILSPFVKGLDVMRFGVPLLR